MKKPKLNLTCFRAFTLNAELHIAAVSKEDATVIAVAQLGKRDLICVFEQMNTEFTRMVLSNRKVGFKDTISVSDKHMHHDVRVTQGRKLPFVAVTL